MPRCWPRWAGGRFLAGRAAATAGAAAEKAGEKAEKAADTK